MQASPADSNDLSAAPTVVRPSSLMRSANRNLRDLSRRLLHSEPIAFFCECRSPECFSIIWMSEASFDAAVSDSAAWLLVQGHEPSAPFTRGAPDLLRRQRPGAPVSPLHVNF